VANPQRARPRPPTTTPEQPPRIFTLQRTTDHTGLSGTGAVAWGIQFPDGRCVTQWRNSPVHVHQLSIFNNIREVSEVHGHGGATRVIWLHTQPATQLYDTARLTALTDAYRDALHRATHTTFTHLPLAAHAMAELPAFIDAYDGLAVAHTAALAELEKVRAEAAAMQAALDALAEAGQP
jgi:hypothetical protein